MDISEDEFVELAGDQRPVVVRATATLPELEPLAAYAALTGRTTDVAAGDYAFLLESAEKVASSDPDGAFAPTREERHARFSFVGYDPDAVVSVGPAGTTVDALTGKYADLLDASGGHTLDRLRATLPDLPTRGFPEGDRQQLDGGLVGFLSYEAVYDLWLDEVGVDRPASRFPDAEFVLTTKTVAFDHAEDSVSLVFTPAVRAGEDAGHCYRRLQAEAERVSSLLAEAPPPETGGFRQSGETAGSRENYETAVERARDHVYRGDIYQGVISRTRELRGEIDPLGLYESLRAVNPSPYMYLLDHDDLRIVGASPETLVSVHGNEITSNPIAGTCPHGDSPVEDRRLAGEMLADDKERAEHTMLVDLARNDVRRVAEPGSVRVREFMNVLKYSHVQHIESTVTGRLSTDSDAFDAVGATFPAGTLAGAPKTRAMEIIDELEEEPRGPYGGGVGYVSWTGDADFAIVIRSAVVEDAERVADAERIEGGDGDQWITVRAGAGIVADSDPAAEYDETEQKMDGVVEAIERIAIDPEPVESGEVGR